MATISRQPEANLTFEPLQTAQVSESKEYIPAGDATATLCFFSHTKDGAAPYNFVESPPEGVARSNLEVKEIPVTVHDLNAHPEFTPNLDDNAFQIAAEATAIPGDFSDEELIKDVYYKEVKEIILRNVPGAKDITIFDHTIRRSHPGASRGPVNRVHIDQTRKSGPQRVYHHHPDTAEALVKDRVRIINVWRAINPPIVDSPLAFADAATVDQADLVGVRHIYPDRVGETAGVKYNPNQRWWYKSGFGKEDVVLLQCYDSHGKQSQAPHTAFSHPDEKVGRKGRESIEVRVLVWG